MYIRATTRAELRHVNTGIDLLHVNTHLDHVSEMAQWKEAD
jgi:hypothetical protein